MNLRPHSIFSPRRLWLSPALAFTLIELLAVIAIIAIIAGMIVGLAPGVNQNKKRQRVDAEKNHLTLLIDNYKAKFGHYPPDNPYLAAAQQNSSPAPIPPALYDELTQINPLLYELTGGTNNLTGNFTNFNGTNFSQTEFEKGYGLRGVLNADAEQQVIYKPLPQPNAYMNYPKWSLRSGGVSSSSGSVMSWPGATALDLQGLIVPVDMVQADDPANPAAGPGVFQPVATTTNFWHYDASSSLRHNIDSYDLWAEFVVGKKSVSNIVTWLYVTNGNW